MTSETELTTSAPEPPSAGVRMHGLSVDVEDYFQVWGFSDVISRSSWDGFPRRVDLATRAVLDLFDDAGVKATFFTLGWVAEREPALIRDIVARGHELASHGYDHTKVFDQSPAEFREDVAKTRAILEDVGGVRVVGYRAAGFSIDNRTPFAHEILADEGYLYSSSTHPIAHDHYGDPQAPQTPYRPVPGDTFMELPVATTSLYGRRISCAGGGWFRAMPYPLARRLIRRAAGEHDGPVIFYFHPWEIDVDQPRIDRATRKSKLRHYLNLDQMRGKLSMLCQDFAWGRIDRVFDLVDRPGRSNRPATDHEPDAIAL